MSVTQGLSSLRTNTCLTKKHKTDQTKSRTEETIAKDFKVKAKDHTNNASKALSRAYTIAIGVYIVFSLLYFLSFFQL
jgi:hypothetical protein